MEELIYLVIPHLVIWYALLILWRKKENSLYNRVFWLLFLSYIIGCVVLVYYAVEEMENFKRRQQLQQLKLSPIIMPPPCSKVISPETNTPTQTTNSSNPESCSKMVIDLLKDIQKNVKDTQTYIQTQVLDKSEPLINSVESMPEKSDTSE